MKDKYSQNTKFVEIPKEFYSDSSNSIFKKCTFCNKDLNKVDATYLIEKSFKINPNNGNKNTVYEYAICMSCNLKKMKALSKESLQNIQNYIVDNFVLEELQNEFDLDRKLLDKCAVTGINREDLKEYNVVGQFISDKMIVGKFPILLSPSIGDEIQELLSQKTKDEFDDFMDTINNVPPELKELFKSKRPVLI